MKKILIIFAMFMALAATVHAHGNISKLPDSVQILQYQMKLYMNVDDFDSRNNLAMAYFRTGRLEEARKELVYIIDKDAVNFDALDGMGIVLFKMGRNREALEYLNKAVAINPQDMMVHVHLSLVCGKLDMKEQADREMAMARSMAEGPEKLKEIDTEIAIISGS